MEAGRASCLKTVRMPPPPRMSWLTCARAPLERRPHDPHGPFAEVTSLVH